MFDTSNLTVEKKEVVALFPTFVWKTQLKREDYEVINEKIRNKLKELTADKPSLEPGNKWQTEQELHKLEEFRQLNAFIHVATKGVLDFLKIVYDDFEITGCWANISAAQTGHVPHTHPNNYLSGVYYVQADNGANTITFDDPRPQTYIIKPSVSEQGPANSRSAVMTVEEGTLVMFPAWLLHSVEPNMSDRERISVSFNIMFTSFSEKMSKPQWQGNVGLE
ncbi:MAG: 2OG-Fe(II) oxygenase family protein [Acidiferrobacterales bacterium]